MSARSSSWLAPGFAIVAAGLILAACGPAVDANGEEPEAIVVAAAEGVPEPTSMSTLGGYLAGRYAYSVGDFSAAADYLSKALEENPDNLELLGITLRVFVVDGRIEEAVDTAERLIERVPGEPMAGLVLALHDIKAGRLDAAEARLPSLDRGGAHQLLMPMIEAWIAYGQDGSGSALDHLASLLETPAFKPFYDYHAGLISDLSDQPDAAERYYLEALEGISRGTLRVVEALGRLYERERRPDDARRVYGDYAEENPDSLWFEGALGRIDSGETPGPLVTDLAEGIADALFGTAGVIPQNDGGELALFYTQLALYLWPEFPAALMLLGEVFELNDQTESAVAAYRRVESDGPADWTARVRIAANLDQLGRPEEAITLLREMAGERAERSDVLITLGDILRANERFSEAVVAYDQALEREPDVESYHWTLYYARGVALERAKMWERAESDFLKALELEPEQPFVLNYLGYSWIERGERLVEAREMIERAVELRPDDGYIVDSLGWARYQQGEYGGAVEALEHAVELEPNDPIINDHLGDAYWQVGRRMEARFQWERALVLEPTEEDAKRIRDKLSLSHQPDADLSNEL